MVAGHAPLAGQAALVEARGAVFRALRLEERRVVAADEWALHDVVLRAAQLEVRRVPTADERALHGKGREVVVRQAPTGCERKRALRAKTRAQREEQPVAPSEDVVENGGQSWQLAWPGTEA